MRVLDLNTINTEQDIEDLLRDIDEYFISVTPTDRFCNKDFYSLRLRTDSVTWNNIRKLSRLNKHNYPLSIGANKDILFHRKVK